MSMSRNSDLERAAGVPKVAREDVVESEAADAAKTIEPPAPAGAAKRLAELDANQDAADAQAAAERNQSAATAKRQAAEARDAADEPSEAPEEPQERAVRLVTDLVEVDEDQEQGAVSVAVSGVEVKFESIDAVETVDASDAAVLVGSPLVAYAEDED